MASKQPRFTRKVYECWALECSDGELHGPDSGPYLFSTRRAVLGIAYTDERPIPVRVTVERIERKTKGKG